MYNGVIDLRSDTVTRPSQGMRRAIAEAEVGDDVFGEDPTVNRLQEVVAGMLEVEAALLVVSGTMGNQVAVKAHTQAGDEIIVGHNAHILTYESGALGGISGVQVRTVETQSGVLVPEAIEGAVRMRGNDHYPPTTLICLENTHNLAGGRIYPLEEIEGARRIADAHGLSMHLDGARLFNACVATGIRPATYARYFDSVAFCLSKGLGAPVGSVLAGSEMFIERAQRFRKMFGGSMRQAGILAAAGLYALEHHIDRLQEDHSNAKRLAEGLASIEGTEIDPDDVETNMVFLDTDERVLSKEVLVEKLRERNILVLPIREPAILVSGKPFDRIRMVTHLDVSREDIDRVIEAVREVALDS